MCEPSPSLGNVSEVFKGPQVNDGPENVGRLNGNDPLIAFVDSHTNIEGVNYYISGNIGGNKCFLNPYLWTLYLFDHLNYGDIDIFQIIVGNDLCEHDYVNAKHILRVNLVSHDWKGNLPSKSSCFCP